MPFLRTLSEVLAQQKESVKDDIRKVLPATVTGVNISKQTVDVKIAVNNPMFDQFGNTSFEELPGIKDVKYGYMRASKFMVWIPPSIGDSVLLLFSDLSLDTWRESEGSEPVEPGWVGKHTADSPIAIPFVFTDSQAFLDPAAGKVIIGLDGSPAQIRISPTEIDLGSTAVQPVALAPSVVTALTAIATYVAALTAALAANPTLYPPFAAAMAAPGATLAAALASVGTTIPATLVKGE